MLYALPLFGKLDKEENKTTRANKNNEIVFLKILKFGMEF